MLPVLQGASASQPDNDIDLGRILEDTTAVDPVYTDAQEMVLIITPYFTAPLSVLGSGLILYVILRERSRTLKETYHRQMFGLSLLTFMNALGVLVLGHWALPADLVDSPGARGTTTTCSISGFFLNLIFGSMWYMFFLSLCFALRIMCECRQKCIARYCETIGHVIGFVLPVLTGISAALEDWMNPLQDLPGWCWSTDYPNGCESNDSVECIRGDDYEGLGDAATIILLWTGIIICMVLIVWKVRKTELRLRNYAGGRTSSLIRTKQAGVQALWYIGVFFIVYLPIAVLMSLGDRYKSDRRDLFFSFAFLTKLLAPLQGFLTSVVYFRSNFRSLQQDGRPLACLARFFQKLSAGRVTESTTRSSARTGATSNMEHGNELHSEECDVEQAAESCHTEYDDAETRPNEVDAAENSVGDQG